ncbi:MAG: hypothetical protein ACRC8S_03490 [Fimbriiglobus sp.]
MNPGARDYLLLTGGSLGVCLFVLLAKGGALPTFLVAVPGFLSLAVRWRVYPLVVLTLIGYLSVFPELFPMGWRTIPQEYLHFRILDIAITLAASAYIFGYFRMWGLRDAILPKLTSDVVVSEPHEGPRSEASIESTEYASFFLTILVAAAFALALWKTATYFDIRGDGFPLVTRDSREEPHISDTSLVMALFLGPIFGSVGFGIWYGRWSQLRPDIARQMLLDMAWAEQRREYSQRELWRAWGRGQLAKQEPFSIRIRTVFRILLFGAGGGLAITLMYIVLRLLIYIATKI